MIDCSPYFYKLKAIFAADIMMEVQISTNVIKPLTGIMTKESEVHDDTSIGGWFGKTAAITSGRKYISSLHEDDQKDIDLIVIHLKVFTDGVFTAFRKLTLIRWAGKRVDIHTNRIKQWLGMAEFKEIELERLSWPLSQDSLMPSPTGAKY